MFSFRSFMLFIRSIIFGENIINTYFLETETSLQSLYNRIKDLKPYNYLDQKNIEYQNDEITIKEVYDTGIRRRQSTPKIVFNRSYTTIIRNGTNIEVSIEIERSFLARVNTILLIVLNFSLLFLVVLSLFNCTISYGEFTFNSVDLALIELFALIVLIIVWKIAVEKYAIIVNHIKEYIE